MGPLGFVDWQVVSVRFRLLMWVVAFALGLFVLVHAMPARGGVHHAVRSIGR